MDGSEALGLGVCRSAAMGAVFMIGDGLFGLLQQGCGSPHPVRRAIISP
ncbi:hypothetical protein GGR44_001840 [Sphingobium fontiphilum]|uniref:Uncharacterized protein n=1 Tax=Sphingobium fontiphilum TaxID=944425 RepID=A0A7W6DIY3_9SPHN|nr:hypothetical protein [Sphingobium fontiphilum]MBB3982181.1 hypothetical protein [Sphingobium fontiphilum]